MAIAFVTILSGGMVAGINAGFINNTWPLMDGGLLPDDFAALSPFWLNFFENHSTVQFGHRMLAYLTAIVAGLYWFRARSAGLQARARMAANLLGAMVVLQIAAGYFHVAAGGADLAGRAAPGRRGGGVRAGDLEYVGAVAATRHERLIAAL